MAYPIQFQFHLSDFVDYGHPDLADQVPDGHGVYVPQALGTSLTDKMIVFQKALDIIAEGYSFNTLGSMGTEQRNTGMKRQYLTLGHRLPAFLANPLFGDRCRFGLGNTE